MTDAVAARLSARECDVAKLLAQGWSIAQTADELSIAEKTVQSHITAIYRKTGFDRRGLICWAWRSGFIK